MYTYMNTHLDKFNTLPARLVLPPSPQVKSLPRIYIYKYIHRYIFIFICLYTYMNTYIDTFNTLPAPPSKPP